jgi:hypothetical protein
MAIGLTFEEYVELKLMPPKHADRAFVTAAEHMRDEAFLMSLDKAAWHVRMRATTADSKASNCLSSGKRLSQ